MFSISTKFERRAIFRFLTLLFVTFSVILTAITIFTDRWFQERNISLNVWRWNGLWRICSERTNQNFTRVMLCRKLNEDEITGTIKAARILLSTSLVINCLVNVVAILMKIFKRKLMMDVLSVMILISNILLTSGLSVFVDKYETFGSARYVYGYSMVTGWISFACLVVANLFSLLSRNDKEK
ncbi:epithelial membrane protein 2-like [Hydractinia symbiolongicarpus]|uniref:epithelial membrane protein 2-like n=1 Tax=Hydractinia symbiolongicarpus TaxID=13093 RepID=UPI0025519493|nr:epithelial membrane protein 2-like [Hydractinia symbiolongicarpus]